MFTHTVITFIKLYREQKAGAVELHIYVHDMSINVTTYAIITYTYCRYLQYRYKYKILSEFLSPSSKVEDIFIPSRTQQGGGKLGRDLPPR